MEQTPHQNIKYTLCSGLGRKRKDDLNKRLMMSVLAMSLPSSTSVIRNG